MAASIKYTSRVTVEVDQSDDDDDSMSALSGGSVSESEQPDASNAKRSDGEDSHAESDVECGNEGWADSMAKILRAGKPKGKKTLVLAKAKKLADVMRKVQSGDGVDTVKTEDGDEKPDVDAIKTEADDRRKAKTRVRKKNEHLNVRIKPKVLDRDRERTLSKIATRGVVQLFNAVRNQQKAIDKQMEDAGPLDRKKEKALKKFDKRSFLDALMGPTRSTLVDEVKKTEPKSEDSKPKWNVLRDDFMMGAKMKDWDRDAPEDAETVERKDR